MKYINVDLLRAVIKEHTLFYAGQANLLDGTNALDGYDEVLAIIDSLQQEQESVAERFARIVRGNLIGIDKEVQQKFEQLYFEVTGNKMYGGDND
jgi:hypothetical protein